MSAEGFRARARPEPPSAQILVVVANTLERSWRTDAEKGFLSTAVAQVLVDPKPRAKALQRGPPTFVTRARGTRERSSRASAPERETGGRVSTRSPLARRASLGSARTLLPAPLRRGPGPGAASSRTPNPVPLLSRKRYPSDRSLTRRSRSGRGARSRAKGAPKKGVRSARCGSLPGREHAVGIPLALGAGHHGRARSRGPLPSGKPGLAARLGLPRTRRRSARFFRPSQCPPRGHTSTNRHRSDMAKGNPVKIPGPGE